MSIIGKLKQSRKDIVAGDSLLVEDFFAEQYPGIFEMITLVKYQGEDRKPGRLILYAEPNRATLVLCDREAGMVTFYAKEGFADALEGLERALQDGSADWRKDKRSRFAN